MSSSFLYLAIVAVWAFVLVPRWLRRPQVQPQVEVDVEVDLKFAVDDDTELRAYQAVDDARGDGYADDVQVLSYASVVDGDVSGRPRYSAAPLPRSRVLQARRRLLTMLLLLTAAAAACTVLKVTSWWVCIPPAVMLSSYLLLLREAAVADAEQARRQAAMEMRAQAARQRELAAATERDAQPSAQIIDISARVGDQLYDQYADATVRAVGD